MMSLKQTLLEDDILPLGKFESLPIISILDGRPESYPNVSFIKHLEYSEMLKESLTHINIVGDNYVKPRLNHISVSPDSLMKTLGEVGFFKGSYQSYSIRKLGTSELEEWVLPKTREFFDTLPTKTFRQQYAVAFPGWNTQLHRDHSNFLTHGFRAMVPLSADVYMGYEDDRGNPLIYRLSRGGMYFVNIAKMHRGFNESQSTNRINLIMQMCSDELVIDSTQLMPLDHREILELPGYSINYDIWRFGYEL